jgi:hypothetical protein
MRAKFTMIAAGIAAMLSLPVPAAAGGGGPVVITQTHGRVLLRPIDFRTGRPTGRWRPAPKGGLLGTYLLRTGRGSWSHLDLPFRILGGGEWKYVGAACVDSGSTVRIDSYADSTVEVLRGRISPADGRRVGRLPNRMGEM